MAAKRAAHPNEPSITINPQPTIQTELNERPTDAPRQRRSGRAERSRRGAQHGGAARGSKRGAIAHEAKAKRSPYTRYADMRAAALPKMLRAARVAQKERTREAQKAQQAKAKSSFDTRTIRPVNT